MKCIRSNAFRKTRHWDSLLDTRFTGPASGSSSIPPSPTAARDKKGVADTGNTRPWRNWRQKEDKLKVILEASLG